MRAALSFAGKQISSPVNVQRAASSRAGRPRVLTKMSLQIQVPPSFLA